MQYFKRNNLIAFFLFFFTSVVAQTLPSKNITINDGLPSNGIKCFFKDSRGFMWIGTEAGLCRYDGINYKIYNEVNGLEHDDVWSIAEDDQHNLWLSLYANGLAKFDGKKFTYFDKKDGLASNGIRKIVYSKKHHCLILGTENGLSLFDGKHFKSFSKHSSDSKFQILDINETEKEIYITASYDSIYKLQIKNDINKSVLINTLIPASYFSTLFANTTFYGGGVDKLYVKNLKSSIGKNYLSPLIWSLVQDDAKNIYCAAWNVKNPNGGLFKFDGVTLKDVTKKSNITSTGLWCLFFDKPTKQLWVGSIDKGIFIVDLSQQTQFLEPSYFGLKNIEVQQLITDSSDNIWIGARNKIILLRKDLSYMVFDKNLIIKKIKDYILKNRKIYGDILLRIEEKKTNGFNFSNIIEDSNGFIWFSTTAGYFCFNKKGDLLFYRFTNGGNLIFDAKEHLIFSELYNNTYITNNKYEITKNKIVSLKDQNSPRDIQKTVKDGNTIWFGSYAKGLYRFYNDHFFSLYVNNQFTEKNIKDIIINDKGELVIGTNSGRVYIAKWENNKLKIMHIYQPFKELYGTSISFVEQSNGIYFIGTNKGINVIKNHKFVKLINQSEGIKDIQFNDCSKDKSGNLWVGTNNGLLYINTLKFTQKTPLVNPIQILEVKVNSNTPTQKKLLLDWGNLTNNQILLDHNQNDIEIEYNAINLLNADKNVFRYKIIGVSDTWSDYESIGKLQLKGITNGHYTILIQGKNIGTGATFLTKKLFIAIAPPFWKTWWFSISCISFILVTGYVVYKRRIIFIARQEREKGIIQKRLAETKMEALQSQMNPHFIFNAMNSIQNFIIDNNPDEALMYMGEFSKLIRQTLENSSKPRISLTDEIQYLQSYIRLENMRYKDVVEFSLIINEDIDIDATVTVPMLLQPFIENVFVHAFDSYSVKPKLDITFTTENIYLICTIKDNGKGMPTENLLKFHTSKGISLVKERISLIQEVNKDSIVIVSNPQIGTTVTLRLKKINFTFTHRIGT